MNTHSRLGLLAAATGLLTLTGLAGGAASAAPADGDVVTRSVTLRYDPADLRTPRGADKLLGRIAGAAMRVCDEGGSMAQLIESSSYRNCRHDAIARAVIEVNRPAVTAAYNRHFGDLTQSGLHAALGPQPRVGIHLVAFGGTEAPADAGATQ
ncbi:MAG TPA: UrcA family protein [Gammaproteobacteria bacterium]|jgi:UrcA family protein|nr:UrcA family protein [Gammaproteobacteria bacterium]